MNISVGYICMAKIDLRNRIRKVGLDKKDDSTRCCVRKKRLLYWVPSFDFLKLT